MAAPLTAPKLVEDASLKTWTRTEVHALVDLKFQNAEKLELINGNLFDKMGKKRPHVIWQHRILWWLQSVFGPEFVESESPTDVSPEDNLISEPEPDLKVTTRPIQNYTTNPPPQDMRLVVEISDSTLHFDLKVKAGLYARAAIIEYWVVNIPDKQVVVHREPREGMYHSIVTYESDAEVAPSAAPAANMCLSRLF